MYTNISDNTWEVIFILKTNELNSAHPRLWEGNQTRCPVISKGDKHMVHTSTAQSEWKKLQF